MKIFLSARSCIELCRGSWYAAMFWVSKSLFTWAASRHRVHKLSQKFARSVLRETLFKSFISTFVFNWSPLNDSASDENTQTKIDNPFLMPLEWIRSGKVWFAEQKFHVLWPSTSSLYSYWVKEQHTNEVALRYEYTEKTLHIKKDFSRNPWRKSHSI